MKVKGIELPLWLQAAAIIDKTFVDAVDFTSIAPKDTNTFTATTVVSIPFNGDKLPTFDPLDQPGMASATWNPSIDDKNHAWLG